MKVLFVGFGSIAKKHYDALKKLQPNSTVYALKSGNSSTKETDVIDLFDWKDVPKDISFAIVSNPTFKHTEVLSQLVERNIPVFMEKPLSDKLEGLSELVAKIKQKNIFTYVACNLRFLPVLQYLKNQIIKKGIRINEVSVYCGSFLPDWRKGIDYKEVYSANKEMGGGVHLDLFHELDYTCWLFGMPEKSTMVKSSNSSIDINAVDYANFQFVYPTFIGSITLNYYRRDAKRTIEIVTSEDTFLVDLLANTITNNKGKIIFSARDFAINETYLAQMNYFLCNFAENISEMNSVSDSVQILKICLE